MGEKVIELRALESSLIFKFFHLSKSGTLKHLDTVIHVAVNLLCAHTHTLLWIRLQTSCMHLRFHFDSEYLSGNTHRKCCTLLLRHATRAIRLRGAHAGTVPPLYLYFKKEGNSGEVCFSFCLLFSVYR